MPVTAAESKALRFDKIISATCPGRKEVFPFPTLFYRNLVGKDLFEVSLEVSYLCEKHMACPNTNILQLLKAWMGCF